MNYQIPEVAHSLTTGTPLESISSLRNPPSTEIVTITQILRLTQIVTPFLASRKYHFYVWLQYLVLKFIILTKFQFDVWFHRIWVSVSITVKDNSFLRFQGSCFRLTARLDLELSKILIILSSLNDFFFKRNGSIIL